MDFLGQKKFCARCALAKIEGDDIVCNNPKSALFNYTTNSILCAPCLASKVTNTTKGE